MLHNKKGYINTKSEKHHRKFKLFFKSSFLTSFNPLTLPTIKKKLRENYFYCLFENNKFANFTFYKFLKFYITLFNLIQKTKVNENWEEKIPLFETSFLLNFEKILHF